MWWICLQLEQEPLTTPKACQLKSLHSEEVIYKSEVDHSIKCEQNQRWHMPLKRDLLMASTFNARPSWPKAMEFLFGLHKKNLIVLIYVILSEERLNNSLRIIHGIQDAITKLGELNLPSWTRKSRKVIPGAHYHIQIQPVNDYRTENTQHGILLG